jgi:hypothetical protein
VSARRRSIWAPRLLVLSTVALVICFAVPGTVRALFSFVWVALALTAMALEWSARRRA